EHIMVVNKPSGLLSVPGRLEAHKDSIMTRIQRDYPQAESVHRLDPQPDLVIIGNAMTRGNPCVEAVLEKNIPFMSGPQWLHDFV
ncbi:Mur ligase domain-containing protein, partial [Salmonella enterica subsp. enterica serovar Montevideo]|nr:Mur ligase domain-containing protein [Salmonella enterica subsp. enterica serovar Montevideo]